MSTADPLLHRTLKHYRIDRLLGQGGMGAVYRATDTQLQRAVAVKVMHPQFASQGEFQERFLQEARAAAALDHQNIIHIYDFDLDGGMLYMVTEYVAGGNLRDYLKMLYDQRKFIPVIEALALTRQVADALDYAHTMGVLHRDVKPDNVLLKAATTDGVAFRGILTDFGLAKLAEGGVQSIANAPTGTLAYMSPEQAQAEPVDGRTDLYALGIMLYELTTGRLPFMPRTIPEAIKMHTSVMPDPPNKARPSLSRDINAVIMKAVSKRPQDRYQTGAEFAKALRTVEASLAASQGDGEGVGRPGGLSGGAPEPTESLATYLQSQSQAVSGNSGSIRPVNPPAGASASSAPAAPAAAAIEPNNTPNDRLAILTDGQSPRYFPLVKVPLGIGREPDSDLQLASPKVSRHHAQIDRRRDGQYTIMDTGSANGTYLGETKLLSNIPELWPTEEPVRIGPFWLALQFAAQQFNTGRPVQGAPSIAAPGLTAPPVGGLPGIGGAAKPPPVPEVSSGVAITLKPSALIIEAGGRIDMQIEILNQSELVEHYQFDVGNIPREWFTVPMTTIQLMPGTKGNTSITFHPPRNCNSGAGPHQFQVKVTSQERRKELISVPGQITINPFYQFETDMQPRRVRNRGTLKVLITNKGNAVEGFTLAPRDREQALHFDPLNRSIDVAPCETGAAAFYIRPTHRPLLGFGKRLYTFEVGVAPGSGNVQSLPAELLVTPRIPWWLLLLLLLLLLLCLLLAYVSVPCNSLPLLPINGGVQLKQCPPSVLYPTITQEHATLNFWLTGTATAFDNRETSTYTARNATATQNSNLQATQTSAAGSTATAGVQNATATGQFNVQSTLFAINANATATAAAATQTAQAPPPKH